jgi:hypothetical protein
LCEFVVVATWISMLATAKQRRSKAAPLTPSQQSALRFAGILVASVLLSLVVNVLRGTIVSLGASAVETTNYVYGFLLMCTIVVLVDDWNAWTTCLRVWCLGTMIVSFVALWATFGNAPDWTKDEFTGRVSSTLRASGQVASYCIPVFAFSLMMAARRHDAPWWRAYHLCVAVGAIISALVSGSRIAFILTFFVSISTLVVLGRRTEKNPSYQPAFFRVSGLAILVGLAYFTVSVWNDKSLHYRAGDTAPHHRPVLMLREWYRGERVLDRGRVNQFQVSLREFPKRALFGAGPANFGRLKRMDEPHNTYLGALVNGGAIAFIALGLMLAAVANCGITSLRRVPSSARRLAIECALLGFASLCLYGMTCFSLRQRPLWIICGLIVALPRCVGRRGRPRYFPKRTVRRRFADAVAIDDVSAQELSRPAAEPYAEPEVRAERLVRDSRTAGDSDSGDNI